MAESFRSSISASSFSRDSERFLGSETQQILTKQLSDFQARKDLVTTQISVLDQLIRDFEARYLHAMQTKCSGSRKYHLRLKLSIASGIRSIHTLYLQKINSEIISTRRRLIDELIASGRSSGYGNHPGLNRQLERLENLSNWLEQLQQNQNRRDQSPDDTER